MHVESGLVTLMHVRAGSLPGRQRDHAEPDHFRADGLRADARFVVAALLSPIPPAALDDGGFHRNCETAACGLGRFKDRHGDLPFDEWIEAHTIILGCS